jgi:HlyD family secretion protein
MKRLMTLDSRAAMRRQVMTGLLGLVLMGGSATAWAALASLDSAVTAPGVLVVDGNSKKVQHPTGGVVGRLNVTEGKRVAIGDLLLSLDDTTTRAQLAVVSNDLMAFRVRQARLHAERDGQAALALPAELAAQARLEPALQSMIASEARLLASRAAMRAGQKSQLEERIGQLRVEINGVQDQRDAAETTLDLTGQELTEQRDLLSKGLTQKPRVTALEREAARTLGSIGEFGAKISQIKGKITETDLQISQIDRDMATEVQKDLRDTETKIAELTERRIAALDVLNRVDLRAPASGVVHQLNVHTVGGVIGPSEILMMIVPDSARFVVEVQITPADIDQVRPGLPARVRFSAFSKNTTPEVHGTLTRVAADLTREQATGRTYYTGAVSFTPEQLAALGPHTLIAGMPADAFVRTGERTFASYLIKPLADQLQRALLER